MPKTKVTITETTTTDPDSGTETTRTQYRTTIPKQLAEFFQMDGDTELEWSAGSARDKIEITVNTD